MSNNISSTKLIDWLTYILNGITHSCKYKKNFEWVVHQGLTRYNCVDLPIKCEKGLVTVKQRSTDWFMNKLLKKQKRKCCQF